MNKEILKPEVQEFIINNQDTDPVSVSLKKSPFPGVTPQELALQVKGLRTAAGKLTTWAHTPGIYYPPTLNLEQASSEPLAQYKAGLVKGRFMADLTGGFGVDAYFFSARFEKVYYCERDSALAAIASHNFQVLGASNVEVSVGDGLSLLEGIRAATGGLDWIYLDPSRRGKDGGRKFRLEDYQPSVVEFLPQLFRASPNILLKTAPLLDLSEGVKQLGNVREIHITGINNEVRELLWWLQKDWQVPPEIVAADLKFPAAPLRFTRASEAAAEITCHLPMKYLYEPNACMLKAGAFKTAARHYGLFKLHPSTHLYTSDTLVPFPGRRFKIREVLPYKPGRLGFRKANVSTRNFPESVARIRKRNRIRDGGATYLFFVRCKDESLCVLVSDPA